MFRKKKISIQLLIICIMFSFFSNTLLSQTKKTKIDDIKKQKIIELFNAVVNGDLKKTKNILKREPELINIKDVNKNGLLRRAVLKQNIEMVSLLIEMGLDPNADDRGMTALETAVVMKNTKLVKLLVNRFKADVNRKGKWQVTPILGAVETGDKLIVNFLLKNGAKYPVIEKEINYQIGDALSAGLGNILNIIIRSKHEINYNFSNKYKNSFLHLAAKGGLVKWIKILLDKGLNIDQKNSDGWTPLHFAIVSENMEAIDYLIGRKCNVNTLTMRGESPYNIAERLENKDLIKKLKRRKFNTAKAKFPKLTTKYVDSKLPGKGPVPFSSGIISLESTREHGPLSFSADFKTVCWIDDQRRKGGINKCFIMNKKNGVWGKPEVVLKKIKSPFISPDGKRIYFMAKRRSSEGHLAKDNDIYYIIRKEHDQWSDWINPGSAVNTENNESYVSVTRDNTIYFENDNQIFRSRLVDGKYQPKERISSLLSKNQTIRGPFIASDESYLLFKSNKGRFDLFISFHKPDDTWTSPVNLGKKIGLKSLFLYPTITPDNKYMIYNVYDLGYVWENIEIIKEL